MATLHTPLGPIWLQNDANGALTALHWGTAPTNAPSIPTAAHAVRAYFAGQNPSLQGLHFSPQGTSFQQRVWQQLLTIPYATTLTYGQLATRLGTSPRALGGAVGANPIPILIPCHRVMGQGGKLTGFSAPGGVHTKEYFLALEAGRITQATVVIPRAA
jgi:methylated-DNA-[protein]-cysteine S-methyltransferase